MDALKTVLCGSWLVAVFRSTVKFECFRPIQCCKTAASCWGMSCCLCMEYVLGLALVVWHQLWCGTKQGSCLDYTNWALQCVLQDPKHKHKTRFFNNLICQCRCSQLASISKKWKVSRKGQEKESSCYMFASTAHWTSLYTFKCLDILFCGPDLKENTVQFMHDVSRTVVSWRRLSWSKFKSVSDIFSTQRAVRQCTFLGHSCPRNL